MTEEKIKETLRETRKLVLTDKSHYEHAAKKLLEQHDTEMVEFGDWVEDNFNCDGKNDKGENIYVYIGDGKFYTMPKLLELFKAVKINR